MSDYRNPFIAETMKVLDYVNRFSRGVYRDCNLYMDEASQVSIDTEALALTCAKNAVIVGDSMQLPNIVTNEDRIKLNSIFEKYKVALF